MWSLPLTILCASSGRAFDKASYIILLTSNVGWNGPNALDLALIAIFRISDVESPVVP